MIAALAMYDLPQVHRRADEFWSFIAESLTNSGIADVPQALTRQAEPYDVWTRPDLLLAQTCGYPLTHKLLDRVRLVATPCYDAPGCNGPNYSSLILVRAGTFPDLASLKGSRAAYNGTDSQSGYAAFRAAIAPFSQGASFFGETIATGGHANSIKAVKEGRADVCATDAVTHAMLSRHQPKTVDGLEVIGFTPGAPGLPLITSLETPTATVDALRRALDEATASPALANARAELLITGFDVLADEDYESILAMEQQCIDSGYSSLS